MIVKAMVIQGRYLDSVKLMLISRSLSSLPGVQDAVAILATEENRGILAATDMLVDEVSTQPKRISPWWSRLWTRIPPYPQSGKLP